MRLAACAGLALWSCVRATPPSCPGGSLLLQVSAGRSTTVGLPQDADNSHNSTLHAQASYAVADATSVAMIAHRFWRIPEEDVTEYFSMSRARDKPGVNTSMSPLTQHQAWLDDALPNPAEKPEQCNLQDSIVPLCDADGVLSSTERLELGDLLQAIRNVTTYSLAVAIINRSSQTSNSSVEWDQLGDSVLESWTSPEDRDSTALLLVSCDPLHLSINVAERTNVATKLTAESRTAIVHRALAMVPPSDKFLGLFIAGVAEQVGNALLRNPRLQARRPEAYFPVMICVLSLLFLLYWCGRGKSAAQAPLDGAGSIRSRWRVHSVLDSGQ